jgi:ABC-2 type transport system permease protein
MIRSFRSEWTKTWRRWMVVGGIGLMAAFCVFAVSVFFLNASKDVTKETPQPNGPPKFPFSMLADPEAPVGSISGFAGGFIAVVALVLCAQSMGSEYGWGTLRVLLSREPRRWRILGGKLLAMCAFLGVAVFVSFVVEIGFAILFAVLREVDMSAWGTADAFLAGSGAFLRVWFSASVWGAFGMTLAILFRSAAPAIGFGIGYTFVVENLIAFFWDDGDKWLPGQLLGAFNDGGTARASLLVSGLLLASYAAFFVLVSGYVFQKRDVAA